MYHGTHPEGERCNSEAVYEQPKKPNKLPEIMIQTHIDIHGRATGLATGQRRKGGVHST